MGTAPKDGTAIEILNEYGHVPTQGAFYWVKHSPEVVRQIDVPGRWTSVEDPRCGAETSLGGFSWRPYAPGRYPKFSAPATRVI